MYTPVQLLYAKITSKQYWDMAQMIECLPSMCDFPVLHDANKQTTTIMYNLLNISMAFVKTIKNMC
jgi:hypothetical protein